METDTNIFTVGEFAELINHILSDRGINENFTSTLYHPSLPLQKRFAAAITHEVLLRFVGEADDENWDQALILRDLFDCHTCVIHIAQMYSKGIIDASKTDFFGVHDLISRSDAERIIHRMWNKTDRFTPLIPKESPVKTLGAKDAPRSLSLLRDKAIIYVNGDAADPQILKGSVCIPFSRIYQNPYTVSDDFDLPIFLYSQDRYFSVIAAELLTEHGYRDVTVIDLMKS